jgi:hypothetical protein
MSQNEPLHLISIHFGRARHEPFVNDGRLTWELRFPELHYPVIQHDEDGNRERLPRLPSEIQEHVTKHLDQTRERDSWKAKETTIITTSTLVIDVVRFAKKLYPDFYDVRVLWSAELHGTLDREGRLNVWGPESEVQVDLWTKIL